MTLPALGGASAAFLKLSRTLFPVVRANGKTPPADQFLTLDEG